MKENTGISRRQFLKGALAGAAGLAAVSVFGPSVLFSAKAESETAVAAATTHSFDFAKRTVIPPPTIRKTDEKRVPRFCAALSFDFPILASIKRKVVVRMISAQIITT